MKIMWVKQCHKAPMTGNGNHTTYKNDEIGDGLFLLTHINGFWPSNLELFLKTRDVCRKNDGDGPNSKDSKHQ